MLGKKIANIVFYKIPTDAEESKIATIFYSDGSVRNVTFEEGIDACEEIVHERHIQTKDAFKEMINHDIVHVVSAKEFRDNFYQYIPQTGIDMEEQRQKVLQSTGNVTPMDSRSESRVTPVVGMPSMGRNTTNGNEEASEDHSELHETSTVTPNGDIDDTEIEEDVEENSNNNTPVQPTRSGVVTPSATDAADEAEAEEEDSHVYHMNTPQNNTNEPVITPVIAPIGNSGNNTENRGSNNTPVEEAGEEEAVEEVADDTADIEDENLNAAAAPTGNNDEPKEEKEGFFKRTWRRIKENKLIKRLILFTTALAVACGIYSCSKKQTLEGQMYNSNIPGITSTVDDDQLENDPYSNGIVVTGDIDENTNGVVDAHFYEDATIKSLLDATSNQTQKNAMYNVGLAMDGFNNVFAGYYLEDGKDVRAALKFEEVVALQVAYNDYSKDELKAIFNGTDVRATDLTRAYKDASLQLMGAYAIENDKHPVDMSMLVDSEEGKEFYHRYHQAFLAAKMATDPDEKIRLVSEFYKMVRADFPITTEVRTEGISHAQNYEDLEAYKLSVTPMIAAAEMMWQNLPIDETLKDGEIDFINDLGLCNYAEKTFERAELIALTSEVDKNNPTYDQYREAYINYFKAHGTYYIDDEHRELTKLQSFQDAVNWHFEQVGGWTYTGQTWTETETHQEVTTHTETTTQEHEEITVTPVDEEDVPEEIRQELQDQVDAEIERENEEARRRAEQEAEEERQRLQAIEDQHAAEVEQEVMQDEQDLQETVDHINEQINENHDDNPQNDQPVNEHDYEGIDFDDDHSDQNGNLDDSVQNVTTDPTGDMTDQPLPDPNDTGRDFDAEGEELGGAAAPIENNAAQASEPEEHYEAPAEQSNQSAPVVEYEEPVVESYSDTQWVESVQVPDDYYYENAWVEEDPVDYSAEVDAYVESLDGAGALEEEAMEYVR